mgnify:CR=1 FL=1
MTDWSTKSDNQLAQARENALAKLENPGWAERAREMLSAVDAELARRGAEPSGLHPDTAAQVRAETARMPPAERIAEAFRARPPSDAEVRAIRAVHANPNATSGALTAAAGWPGETTWHLVFGTMCWKRAPWLPAPPASVGRPGELFYSGVLCDFDRAESTFVLKPEAVTGLRAAGVPGLGPPAAG